MAARTRDAHTFAERGLLSRHESIEAAYVETAMFFLFVAYPRGTDRRLTKPGIGALHRSWIHMLRAGMSVTLETDLTRTPPVDSRAQGLNNNIATYVPHRNVHTTTSPQRPNHNNLRLQLHFPDSTSGLQRTPRLRPTYEAGTGRCRAPRAQCGVPGVTVSFCAPGQRQGTDMLDVDGLIAVEKETRARTRRVNDANGYHIGDVENKMEIKDVDGVLTDPKHDICADFRRRCAPHVLYT